MFATFYEQERWQDVFFIIIPTDQERAQSAHMLQQKEDKYIYKQM